MTTTAFFEKYGIKITDNEDLRDKEQGITPLVQRILDKELSKLKSGRSRGAAKRLKTLIGKYPKVPTFYNYLSAFYDAHGKHEEAYRVNHKLVEKFPNYLFGITNYAKELLLKDDAAKALTIIGEDLNIATRFPESEEFTRSEVANFQEIVFMYHLFEKNDVAKAKEALAMM